MPEHENVSIDDILTAFREFDGVYQKEMVDAAIARRDEIIPRLIVILKQVTADPDEYIKDEDLYDHIYALMLLGHFKAAEAHDAIIDLFSLPGETPHELFGEIATDNLPVILLNTSGGSLDKIRAMALDRDVDVYVRASALHAMAFAVAAGIAHRQMVVSFLGTLFTGAEAEEKSEFWSFAACMIHDLYPEENMAVIENAYARGLILPQIIDRGTFDEALAAGRDAMLERLKSDLESLSLDELHGAMSWWACFQDELDLTPASDPADIFSSGMYGEPSRTIIKTTDKAEKKKKRKQTQASKRKNRKQR